MSKKEKERKMVCKEECRVTFFSRVYGKEGEKDHLEDPGYGERVQWNLSSQT